MRVLIADDSLTQRTQLTGLLRRAGHDVEAVDNGPAALQLLLETSGPKLALLDWEMPGLDGIEVCRRVRTSGSLIRPHVCLLTGRSDRQDVIDALKAGADDFLTKPVAPFELLARLRIGLRNIETQNEVLARTASLELALRRLEVASAMAARVGLSKRQPDEPVEQLVKRKLESLLSTVEVVPSDACSAAHGALVVQELGAWLDVALEVHGSVRLTTSEPPETQDFLGDLVSLLLKRTAAALDAQELIPLPGRSLTRPSSLEHGRTFKLGSVTLTVAMSPLECQTVTYERLEPNVVLLRSLRPRSMTSGEVLRAGTWLRPAHLDRSKPFFQGSDVHDEVVIGKPSPYALLTNG